MVYLLNVVITGSADPEHPAFLLILNGTGASREHLDERFGHIGLELVASIVPDGFKGVVVWNVAIWIRLFIAGIKAFFPKSWHSRIQLTGRDPSDVLFRLVPLDQLPVRWGGHVPDHLCCTEVFIEAQKRKELHDHVITRPVEEILDPRLTWAVWTYAWPACECPNAVLSGRLQKQGRLVKLFRDFFCVLTHDALLYYHHPEDKLPHGRADLRDAQLHVGPHEVDGSATSKSVRAHGFVIATPLCSYLFLAHSDVERDQWCEAIQRTITALTTSVPPPT